nr:hypothetical protein [Tanacetum cinerariifolium]
QGDNGDAGGEDIARSLTTSESVHAGKGTGAGIEILAVVRYAGCGGGVAADSSDNQQDPPQGPRRHRPLDAPRNQTLEHTQVVPALAPRGQAYNLERVVPEERPLHMGPLASQVT